MVAPEAAAELGPEGARARGFRSELEHLLQRCLGLLWLSGSLPDVRQPEPALRIPGL